MIKGVNIIRNILSIVFILIGFSVYGQTILSYQNNTSDVIQGSTNQEIICVTVEVAGNNTPVSSFTFSLTGTGVSGTDLTNATLYETGTSGTFSTASAYDASIATPGASFTFGNGSYKINKNVPYYFWLTFDVPAGATVGNTLDAICTSVTVAGSAVPHSGVPAGSRTIVAAPNPTINVSVSSLTGYSYVEGSGPSTSQSFNLSGTDLDGTQITVSAPTNYEVSLDNSSFSTSVIQSYTAPTLASTPIYVRLKAGLTAGTYNSELVTCNDDGSAANVTVSNDGTVTAPASGCASDLIISEYVEGSSFNKFLEIYNNTGAAVDLSIYDIRIYSNGATSPSTTINLSGTLNDATAYIVEHSSESLGVTSDLANGSLDFNGDDVVTLAKSSTNIDVIGTIGSTANFAENVTWVRKSTVTSPVTTYNSAEWDSYAEDDVSDLGSHTMACGPSVPSLTTTAISSITTTTASSGGNVTNDGSSTVTSRGVCWSTSSSPTTADSKTVDGSGTGSFVSSITGLSANTTYYVRAYAINTTGTGYGDEKVFTTSCTSATIPYSEGFENGGSIPNCWSVETVTDSDSDAEITFEMSTSNPTGGSPDEGSYLVRFNSYSNDVGDELRLISQTLNTTGNSNLEVHFAMFEDNGYSSNNETVTLQWSTDGSIWNTVDTYNRYNASGNDWSDKVSYLPIGAENQSTLYVGFLFYSDWGNDIYIDDVVIIEGNDSDSEASAPTGGQQAGGTISSLDDTDAEAVNVFKFDIDDQGSGDGTATKVTNIRILPGANNTADWTDHIQGVKLNGGAITIGSPTITDTYIDIPITSGNLDVSDGASSTITMSVYLNTSNIIDAATLSFMIDASAHGWTADVAGSTFASTFTADVVSNDFVIDVSATQLVYVTQPSNTIVSQTMSPDPTVKACDANGNTDTGYSSLISVSSDGSLTGDPVSGTWSAGVATFANLVHSATGTTLTLTATSGALNVASNNYDITDVPSIFISEISPKGYNGGFNDEFIELTNNGSSSIDLTNYTLEYWEDQTPYTLEENMNLTGTIAANSAYVIAARSTNNLSEDFLASFTMSGNCYVILKENGIVIDEAGSSSDDFLDNTNYEFTNCGGDNKPTANWDDLSGIGGTPGVVNCACTPPTTAPSGIGFSSVTGTSMTVSWTPGDGDYSLVLVHQEAAVDAEPSSGSTYTANATYGSGSELGTGNFVAYNNTGSSFTLSGLSDGYTYYFAIYTYNSTDDCYNMTELTGNQTTICSTPGNVTGASATIGNTELTIGWTNPICYDEIVIIAKEAGSPSSTLSGDGSSYVANAAFATTGTDAFLNADDYCVYKGTGTSVNVTGLTNGTNYCFHIHTRVGTNWTTTPIEVCATPTLNVPTTLYPGDFIIVGFDTNIGGGGDDIISIASFVPIGTGTTFILANVLYEYEDAAYVSTGRWYRCSSDASKDISGHPQYLEVTYNGATPLAAGTVLCLTLNSNDDCLSSIQVNGVVSTDFTDNSSGQVNMSSADPDAIFLMQGTFSAIQNDGTFNYRTFDGRVLGAIQSRGDFQPFSVAGNNGGERISRIHPDLICLAQNTGGGSTEFYQYYLASEDHSNTQHNLLMNIFDMPGTWVLGTGSNTINEVPICGDSFTVTEGVTHGEWTGESNVDWFNCANWENYAVPDSTTDVIINTDTPDKNCDIDIDTYSATAARYGNVAYCNNLTIQGPSTGDDKKLIIEANNMNLLKVNGNLTISGYGLLDMDDGNPGSLDGTLQIKGNWDNQVGEAQFEEGNGSIEFNGDIQQQISANGAAEIFYNLEVDNSAGVLLNDDIEVGGITGALTLTDGVITTGSQKVYVTNISAASAITGYSESSYVNGNLRRKILSNGTYPFPVGDGTTTGNYKRMNVIASGLDLSGSPDYLEVKVESFTESGNDIDANLVATQSGSLLTNALESGLWTVTPSNSTISAGTWGAQLYVQNISNLSASDDNKFTVLKRTTGSTDYADWDSFDDDGTSIPSENTAGRIYDSGDGYAEKTGFTSFSELIIAKSPVVLPINLLDFSAQVNNDVVNLDWITLSEENNNYFTIERSGTDGDFKEIARIQGADNSNDKLYYNHIDKKPLQGCSYYRLKQTDYDETSTYSKPVTIYFNHMTNENKVYYSNENRQLHLYLNNNGNNNVQIYSSDGKMIYSSPLSDNDTSTISVSDLNLSKGVYIVKVFSNTETTSTKFVVY